MLELNLTGANNAFVSCNRLTGGGKLKTRASALVLTTAGGS